MPDKKTLIKDRSVPFITANKHTLLEIIGTGKNNSGSNVNVIGSIIKGGRFSIKNVPTFKMFDCTFKSDIPKYAGKYYAMLGKRYSSTVKKWVQIVQEIDIDKITEHSNQYIPSKHKTIIQSTLRIIHLENVDYFKAENCNTTKTLFRMLFHITKRSKGIVKDINLKECIRFVSTAKLTL